MENTGYDKYPEPINTPAEEKHYVGASNKEQAANTKRKRSCPMYFGVKSYLHNFYEDHSFKDPSVYEDDDRLFLLKPHSRRRRCLPIWWKIFMCLGVVLLVFGVVGILVGYLVPPRHVLIMSADEGNTFLDTSAQAYNTTLDMCKLIGLILFCVGGVTLAMSLLFPSFLAHYCVEDFDEEEKHKLADTENEAAENEALGHAQMAIPSTAEVKNVQPTKNTKQQMMTQSSTETQDE